MLVVSWGSIPQAASMIRGLEEKRGVLGRDKSLPNQGAVCEDAKADETKRQSCQGSRQLRIRLPGDRAKDLLELKPSEREHVMGLLRNKGIDFTQVGALVVELRELRLAIINALRMGQSEGTALNAVTIEGAIKRINELLGGGK